MGFQWNTTEEEKRQGGKGIVYRREGRGLLNKKNRRLRVEEKGKKSRISDHSTSLQKVSLQYGLVCAQVCRAKLHCFFLRCADPTNTHTNVLILQL